MQILKTLPIAFRGELHDVHLVNFTVDPDEIQDRLPGPLRPALFRGRALISTVNVQLRRMRAAFGGPRFHYRHVGFRLLLQDDTYQEQTHPKGIFFLQSFTNKPLIVASGKLLTNFRLENAQLTELNSGLLLRKGNRYFRYETEGPTLTTTPSLTRLRNAVAPIDRAYAVMRDNVYVTRILRKSWPLEPIACPLFRTNFFESAQLEGVFRVPETIHYTWLAPQKANVCASQSLARLASSAV